MFRLVTLGSVGVERDGTLLSGRATQRRRLALLALLAAARDQGVARDKLLAYLWPERELGRARHSLSQALYELRRELGAEAFLAGVDDVRLNPAAGSSDVRDLLDAAAAHDHARVAALYAGPFLDGFFLDDAPEFERWADERRRDMEASYARALEALARQARAGGDAAAAVEWLRRRAALDPLHSRAALDVGEALAASGDPAGALRYLRGHVRLLRDELGMPPAPEVTELVRRLRTEEREPSAGPAPAAGATRAAPAPAAPAPRGEPRPTLPPQRPAVPQPRAAETPAARSGAPPQPPAAETPAPPPGEPSPPAPRSGAAEAPAPRSAGVRPPVRPPRRRRPGRLRVGLVALAATLVLAAAVVVGYSSSGAPTSERLVVLGAIAGPDSTLALAVAEAIRAEIEATSELRVLGEGAFREALRLMTLDEEAPRTTGVALQAARRTGASVVVEGSVVPLGTGAQVVARALDARSGAVLASVAERPARGEDVVRAVAAVARALREELTGAAPPPEEPLPAVTTASLDALTAYALARRALLRLDRSTAVELAESALVHDSAFALAHYLLADQLWYLDRQRHSDEHMLKALELSDGLPPRERLVVRARHAQLVLDRPDSALVFWRLLARSHPAEPLAWEGMRWAYRALGDWPAMIAASDSAHRLDPTWRLPYIEDRLRGFLLAGDSAGLFAFARSVEGTFADAERLARFGWAFERGDFEGALAWLTAGDAPARHHTLLALGRLEEARRQLDVLRNAPAQHYPRALLAQARAEAGPGGSPERARDLARRALSWTRAADLSPPAYARLAERVADVAARTGDARLLDDTRAFLLALDGGRGLPSYRAALRSLDAGEAFLRGDLRSAAERAAEAKGAMYYGRATSLVVMLEADARRALGDEAGAAALYGDVLAPDAFRDGDVETRAIVRRFARAALEEMSR